jgi:hypothetical protein
MTRPNAWFFDSILDQPAARIVCDKKSPISQSGGELISMRRAVFDVNRRLIQPSLQRKDQCQWINANGSPDGRGFLLAHHRDLRT